MVSDQVIPEEDRTENNQNVLPVSLRNQFSMVEKGITPLMRPSPSPNRRNQFRKATSLYVDTPNKFGTGGANTTLGGMSGMSRQSRVSQL